MKPKKTTLAAIGAFTILLSAYSQTAMTQNACPDEKKLDKIGYDVRAYNPILYTKSTMLKIIDELTGSGGKAQKAIAAITNSTDNGNTTTWFYTFDDNDCLIAAKSVPADVVLNKLNSKAQNAQ